MKLSYTKLQNDIFGGLTAGIVALPLALAFGAQSGLGPIAGLYGAIALGIIGAIFGGTATQISGPTGPMTVISALIISNAIAATGSITNGMTVIVTTFFLAGVFQVLMSYMGIAKYIRYIPYPVISGFMSGIGIIIVMLQIFPMLGYDSPHYIIDVVTQVWAIIPTLNTHALLLTVITIFLVYGVPLFTTRIPSSLIAIVLVSVFSVFYGSKVATIGDIPSGIPRLHLHEIFGFNFRLLPSVIIPAFTLAALGAVDSLLTSTVIDNITKTKHDSDKEIFGQGLGNMAAALIGGIPGAGATMRSIVNVSAGARTRLSGVIHGCLLLVFVFGVGSIASQIPKAALAGILLTIGISTIDFRGLYNVRQLPRSDGVVMIVVMLMTVFVDLLTAVFVGMVIASLSFMKKMGDIAEEQTRVGYPYDFKHLPSLENIHLDAEVSKHIYVKYLYGPLFFGFSTQFQELIIAVPDVRMLVLSMERVPYIDQTGMHAMEDAIKYLEYREISVKIIGLQNQPSRALRRMKLIPNLIHEDDLFADWLIFTEWLNRHKMI